jgi:hypothetical protein
MISSHGLKYLTIYKHADNAQQAFSSELASTLHLAIPALEALHRAWSSRAGRLKYERFAQALERACTKIDEYYEKTTESPAYIMVMSTLLLFVLRVNDTTDIVIVVSLKPKGEDGVFQEALVVRTPGRSGDMCRRSGMWTICLSLLMY